MSLEPSGMPPPDPRETLAKSIRDRATLREVKAQLNPNDERDARAADGLRGLATWIERLDTNDKRLDRIEFVDDEVLPSLSLDEHLSHYEFAYPGRASTYEYVFNSLVEDLHREFVSQIGEHETFEWAVEFVKSAEPAFAMAAFAQLRTWLDSREPEVVRQARVAGLSWGQIAKSLGLTWQIVRERYEGLDLDQARQPH